MPNLINLLPPPLLRAFTRAYSARLGAVAALLLTALLVAGALLLLPTHLLLKHTIAFRSTEVAAQAAQAGTNASVTAAASTLSSTIARLSTLAKSFSATNVLTDLLSVPRAGITYSSITIAPANRVIQLTGLADTRDDLHAYQLALSSAPFVTSADLPVSVYAKERDISFTVTIILAP